MKAKDSVKFDSQHKFQVDVGFGAARQKSIELAMVADEDCYELGIERLTLGVASWNVGRRVPLYWVGSNHPADCGTVLMYECRHFFEDTCERLPTSLKVKTRTSTQCS